MKEKEFNLSEKMFKDNDDCNDLLAFHSVENYFLLEDVKEAVRRLKEECIHNNDDERRLNKIVGDKLSK